MGTRGFFGVVVDGKAKLMYNHWDSYPDGLGVQFLKQVRELATDMDNFRAKASAMRLVNDDDKPTTEDVVRCANVTDLTVGEQSIEDWYCLTRKLQGDLELCLETGVIHDCGDSPKDSLFCEWGYLVDLDLGIFEVYKGFQKEPHTLGRFASETANEDGYYPVKLIASFFLNDLPTDEYFCEVCNKIEDE